MQREYLLSVRKGTINDAILAYARKIRFLFTAKVRKQTPSLECLQYEFK